jgi:type I restriction enzyme M protein
MRVEEFDAEKAWWTERKETPQAWRVPIEDVRARGYNLDFKNPNAPELTHEDPDVLLARYRQANAAAATLREQLRHALAAALEGRE